MNQVQLPLFGPPLVLSPRSTGQGRSEAQIVAETGVLPAIVAQAVSQPIAPGSVEAAYLGYRNQPEEYDGFFVGERVGDGLGVPRDTFPTLEALVAQVPG